MNDTLLLTITGLITLLVNHATLYIIFPRRYSLGISIAAPVLFTAAFYTFLLTSDTMAIYFGGLRGLVHVPLIMLLLRGQTFQKIYGIFLVMLFSGAQLLFAKAIGTLIFPHGEIGYYICVLGLVSVLYLAYFLLILRFGRYIFQRLFINGRKLEWALYAFGSVFSFVIMVVLQQLTVDSWQFMAILLFILWSFGVLCFAIINTHDKTKQRYETERLEQKHSEEKALLESLNRTKAEFFGNISHEMKTPLTIIATDIQLAEQFMDEGKAGSAKGLMREAWQETMQMANLVTDALTFTRGQEVSRPMEPFHFGAVIEATLAVFEPLVKKQGNTLVRNIDKTAQLSGNADMLASALVNLLSNANRHTSRGVIKVGWAMDAERFRLTVSDNGSGISPEILPRVFERGVTDGSGTGLGLAIVKNITDLHGGEALIESKAGKGTAVTLMFPMPGVRAPHMEEHI